MYRNKLEKTIIYLLVSSLVSFSTSLSKADKSEKLEQSLLIMWYLISKAERVLEIPKEYTQSQTLYLLGLPLGTSQIPWI